LNYYYKFSRYEARLNKLNTEISNIENSLIDETGDMDIKYTIEKELRNKQEDTLTPD
jgi:hypothetical protein